MDELTKYKKYVKEKLGALTPIFAKASIGDFSKDVEIPDSDDEFTELYAGISIMLEVIRDKIRHLKDDTRELEVLLDNLPVGVYIAEAPSGYPTLTNKRAVELIGREFNKKSGVLDYTRTYDVIKENGEAYPDQEHPIYITIQTGKPAMKDDIVIRREDGEKVALKVQTTPVFNGDNKMISVLAVFDDITREKKLDSLKSEFISIAAHELRSPLSIIRWNLELFLKSNKSLAGKDREKIESIYKSTKEMITLVGDMLSVSCLDQGRQKHNLISIELTGSVAAVLAEVKVVAEQKMVNIVYDTKTSAQNILADKKELHDVILNLLDNSIKFTPPLGRIEIIIEKRDGSVVLEISDAGIGIPKKESAFVFSRFYRASNALSINSPGTGLGLYLVKTFVESWGGRIWFESPANPRFRAKIGNVYNPGCSFYVQLKRVGGD